MCEFYQFGIRSNLSSTSSGPLLDRLGDERLAVKKERNYDS